MVKRYEKKKNKNNEKKFAKLWLVKYDVKFSEM